MNGTEKVNGKSFLCANEDTSAEEKDIDLMVYKLYELSNEEVKIIEPEFKLSKETYEGY